MRAAAPGTLARGEALSAVIPQPVLARCAALGAAIALAGCAGVAGPPVPAPQTAKAGPPAAAASAVSPPRTLRTTPTAVAAATPGAPASASAPPPNQPPPFDAVVREATRIGDGPIVAWRKDERVWLELSPEQFGKPLLLAPRLASGIGEDFIYGGLLRQAGLVEFRRVHNVVQLVLRNPRFVAAAGTPEARSVAAAYSPSLLGAAPLASAPHPVRHSVLIDAGQIFLTDLLGLGLQLQRAYRQGYGLDGRNTLISGVRAGGNALLFEVTAHYATASIAVPTPGAPPGVPQPSTPDNLPDPRSLFIGLNYALIRLPDQPMPTRRADPRVGYFTTVVDQFGDDLARTPRQRYLQRWRLQKKDPAAALSPPVRPITYWIDRSVPLKYREAIRDGILEWNRAFEAIGIQDAIVVKVAEDDNDLALPEIGQVVVRWLSDNEIGFSALAQPQVDPRSGEILRAAIAIESLAVRLQRSTRARILSASLAAPVGASTEAEWAELLQSSRRDDTRGAGWGEGYEPLQCRAAEYAAEQTAYGLDVLAAQDDIDPDGPEAQRFVLGFVKDTAMHEAGHTLGLRHNFRASRRLTDRQLSDPQYTLAHGISGSVMDYLPINLPRPGAPAPEPFQTRLGEYDRWAIEYGYRQWPEAEESEGLAAVAARSAEDGLAFATDEDTYIGVDPEALQFDLGQDPIAFAAKRLEIARNLLERQETRALKPGEDYSALRRSIGFAVRDAARAAGIVLRQIGGVRTLRDYPNTGRDPLQPLPAADQRAALEFLVRQVLAVDGWRTSPALQRRLAPDYLERGESIAQMPTEISLSLTQLDLQRAVLNQLMSDSLASRLLENEAKFDRPGQALRLAEVYRRLDAAIWRELAEPGPIARRRRDLQREHANHLAALLLRPGALSRSDARALLRAEAGRLLARVAAAERASGRDEPTRLHLRDVADSLRTALAAPLQRLGS